MARNFNGSSDYLYTSLVPITAIPFTIGCWFNPASISLAQSFMSISLGGGLNIFNMGLAATSGDIRIIASSITKGPAVATINGGATVGTWKHCCGVFRTTISRSVYLNGGSRSTNTTLIDANSPPWAELAIGSRVASGHTDFFNGKLAEVGIWDIDLSDDEVASLGKGVSPLKIRPEHLVRYYPFLHGYTPEIDLIKAQNLTHTGTTLTTDYPPIIYPKGKWIGGGSTQDLIATSYSNAGGQGDRTATITTTNSLANGNLSTGVVTNLVNGSIAGNSSGLYYNEAGNYTFTNGDYFQFQFGSKKYINQVDIIGYFAPYSAPGGTWKFQIGDGSTFVDLNSFTWDNVLGQIQSTGMSVFQGGTHFRITKVGGPVTTFKPIIGEINFKIAAAI